MARATDVDRRGASRGGPRPMITVKIKTESGLNLALHHYTNDQNRGERTPVLYIHGATFPSELSVGFKFDGRSWADDLAEDGQDVWSLDFAGFGASKQALSSEGGPTLGRFSQAVEQISAAVDEILTRTSASKVSLIAHSWGTLPAGGFAADQPELVDRLILFGPIALRHEPAGSPIPTSSLEITLQAQYDRFVVDVPAGAPPVLSNAHFLEWGQAYLASDPKSHTKSPAAVTIPAGPAMDIAEAWSGQFPYDLSRVLCPVLIVRGEWDSLCLDEDAAWIYTSLLNAADKQDIKLARATHLAHLESGRIRLYEATRNFLRVGSRPSPKARAPVAVIFEVQPEEGRKSDYLDIAAEMRPLLDEIAGFISVERFQSLTNPQKVLSLSFFADEAAITQWRTLHAHRGAQMKGRGGVFHDYRLRVAQVTRDYGMFDRAEAPADSKKAHSQ